MPDHPRRSAPARLALPGVALATLVLAGCASGPSNGSSVAGGAPEDGTPAPRTPASTPSSTLEAGIPAPGTAAATGPASTGRGLPLYAVGQELRLENPGGQPPVSLVVTSLTVQDTCPVDGGRPSHGAFAIVEVDAAFDGPAKTGTAARPVQLAPEAWSFHPAGGARYDGELGTTAAASCQNAGNALPAELRPGASVTGTLVLDLPERDGALTLADAGTDIAVWPLP